MWRLTLSLLLILSAQTQHVFDDMMDLEDYIWWKGIYFTQESEETFSLAEKDFIGFSESSTFTVDDRIDRGDTLWTKQSFALPMKVSFSVILNNYESDFITWWQHEKYDKFGESEFGFPQIFGPTTNTLQAIANAAKTSSSPFNVTLYQEPEKLTYLADGAKYTVSIRYELDSVTWMIGSATQAKMSFPTQL